MLLNNLDESALAGGIMISGSQVAGGGRAKASVCRVYQFLQYKYLDIINLNYQDEVTEHTVGKKCSQ